ncbi:MAG: hypothetical protein H0T60_07430 [Acidobacteria bacterium]|nr:hypothetical protein [Acidobacteriota bacterium]
MSKLAEWCKSQPEWVRDALHRAASVDDVGQAEIDAVANRVAAAHGIVTAGEHSCEIFSEQSLRVTQTAVDQIILCSIGPLTGIDRLAYDQELKFALAGVTLIFGENASGKSGYVRALRQLCHARVASPLRNDVFGHISPIKVSYCYQQHDGELLKKTWAPDDPTPPELGAITVLDTENARVYVEGENEILFLPPEVNCLTRLGKLFTLVAANFQRDADAFESAISRAIGALYDASTPAGRLVHCLSMGASEVSLPSESELNTAGAWNEMLEQELAEVAAELALSPQVTSAKCLRAASVLRTVGGRLGELVALVSDQAVAIAGQELAEKLRTAEVARALAAEQIGGQPISGTGSETWKRLFQYARQFAAEAGIRPAVDPFQLGDPCPLCQRPLDEASARRLAAFDAFI